MIRAWGLVAGLAVASAGCVGSRPEPVQGRSQIGDDPADPAAAVTVGSKTVVGNTDPVPVSGVGLVYRLPGTGSNAPAGGWRTMLEGAMRKQGFSNLKDYLDPSNNSTSLVLVSAVIPPGVRKGDPIDAFVALPDESRTTSLKGGVLLAGCELTSYDNTDNVRANMAPPPDGSPRGGNSQALMGNVMATAGGPLVAGVVARADGKPADGADGEGGNYRAARIWGGARSTVSRPYYLLLNPGDQTVVRAMQIAERLNATFHATAEPNQKVAEAKNRELIVVNVPPAYRHNHYRFLLVARQVPLVPVSPDSPHRKRLEEELLDPATTLTAALKLEALGQDSKRPLRVGLESTSPWVRFAAAEALAYLGQTDGTAELAKLAADHPGLRAHCLKALASMDDAVSTDRLVELMGSPDAGLRYGAFVALRLADPHHRAATGSLLNTSYWLHQVAPGSPGLVHLSVDRRSEVVLFGDGPTLGGPFTLPVGSDFTVSMGPADAKVKVSRIVRVKGEPEVKEAACSASLADVLVTIAKLGGGHSEAVELVRRADRAQVLSAAVAVDALPRQFGVQQLVTFARRDPGLTRVDTEVARVGTVDPDTDAGFEVPEKEVEVRAVEPPPRPPLSREPGRLFGPRRPPEPVFEDPGVVPAAAAEPAAEKPAKDLGRNPGRLFGR